MNKAILILFCLVSQACYAAQTLSVDPHDTVEAIISNYDITKVVVAGDRIQSVRGMQGAYDINNDKQTGAIFLKPTAEDAATLFIQTERGYAFQLHVVPEAVEANTIIVTPKQRQSTHVPKSSSAMHEIIALTKAMSTQSAAPDYYIESLDSEPPIVSMSTEAQLIKRYNGNEYLGELYILKNKLTSTIYLDERLFSAPGIRAVALAKHTLKPQQNTLLMKVRNHA